MHPPTTSEPPPQTPAPSIAPPPAGQPAGVLPLVALLAVLLGLTIAWAVHERQARHRQAGRIEAEIRQTTFVEARTADLLRMLARADTQIIRLTGSGVAETHTATIIWNPGQQGGFVYSDLPGPLRLAAAPDATSASRGLVRFEGASRPAAFHLPPGDWTDVRFAIVDIHPAPTDGAAILFLTTDAPHSF